MTALATAPLAVRPGGAELAIDLAAVAANTRLLASRTAGVTMAVVKADGFGHGAVDVARTALANGATWLGVTSVQEGLALRAAGLGAPVLSWLNPVEADFATAVRDGLDLAVPSLEHLTAVAAAGPARVHLQLDCGLAREGAAPALWPRLCRAARSLERQGRLAVVGVMGHLPCAEQPKHPSNAVGRTRFAWGVEVARAAGLRPPHRHLAATCATLHDPLSHHTMSRIGAGLIGIGSPVLRPALTLTAPVVTCRRVAAGTPVGYGHTWVAPRATHLALLPVGYADGLPRAASHRAEVLMRGVRRPVVGTISMDQVVVDVGATPVAPGEPVTVMGGDGPSLAEWAAWSDTLPHEIATGLGRRLRRTVSSPLQVVR